MHRLHIPLIAILLLVTACSSDEPAATSEATTSTLLVTTTTTVPPSTSVVPEPPVAAESITVWVPSGAGSVVEDAGAAFTADTGVAVEVTVVDSDTLLTDVLADPSAGPEAFVGPHRWLPSLTAAGIAEPLTVRSEVVAGAVAGVTLRDTVYAAPVGLDTVVQFRNPTLLPVAPNEVESLAAGCPTDDEDETGPCLLIPIDSVTGHYPFLVAAGGYVFGPDEFDGWNPNDVGVDSDEALAGVLVLDGLSDADITLGDGNSSVASRFADDVAPLLWGGLAALEALEQTGASFLVESLPPIAGAPARAPIEVTAAWVNAFAPDKRAATDFVTEYLGDPTFADELALALGLAPVNVGFDADPDLVPFVAGARVGDPVPPIFQTDFAWEQLAAAFSQIRSGDDVTGALLDAAVDIRNAPTPEPPAEDDA